VDVAAAPSAASERYMCASVLRLLRVQVSYVCERPDTTACALASSYQYVWTWQALSTASERYFSICVLILLYVSSYYYMCPHTTIYVPRLSPPHASDASPRAYMCPNTTIYLASADLLRIWCPNTSIYVAATADSLRRKQATRRREPCRMTRAAA
jgi:hypothetical protein